METKFKFLTLTLVAIGVAGALSAAGSAAASGPRPGPGEPTLAEVRRLTERFRDVNIALAEGYIRDPYNLCDTATMMELMLTEWGQETRVAHDGTTALEMAKEFKPQVVLLDIGLPKLHGYEVARRLRQQEWGGAGETLVVAITGWGLEADRQGAAAGIDHRLLKPVDPDTLRALLVGKPSHRTA